MALPLERISHATNGFHEGKAAFDRWCAGAMQVRGVQGRVVVCFFLGSPWANWLVPHHVAPRRGLSCGRGAGDGCDDETDCGTSPIFGSRTGRRHGDFDAADADANQRTDLEELEPDGAASRLREVGIVEADAAQGAHQDVSHRVKP